MYKYVEFANHHESPCIWAPPAFGFEIWILQVHAQEHGFRHALLHGFLGEMANFRKRGSCFSAAARKKSVFPNIGMAQINPNE